MNAFSAALALFIPLMVMWLGTMMRHACIVPSQWIGYRTRRAMQSEEAWAFAQKTAGRLWITAGAAMLCVSAVLCVMVYHWMETAVLYFVLAQAALTLGTVPLTERALKRKFGLCMKKAAPRLLFLRHALEEHIAVLRMALEPVSGVGAGNTGLSAFKAQLLGRSAHQPTRHPLPLQAGVDKGMVEVGYAIAGSRKRDFSQKHAVCIFRIEAAWGAAKFHGASPYQEGIFTPQAWMGASSACSPLSRAYRR